MSFKRSKKNIASSKSRWGVVVRVAIGVVASAVAVVGAVRNRSKIKPLGARAVNAFNEHYSKKDDTSAPKHAAADGDKPASPDANKA